MSKKRARLLLIAGTALIVLAGSFWYWKKSRDAARPLDIVLIQKALDDTDFWTSVYLGGQTAAEEYNVNLTVDGPENEREIDAQNQMILDAIACRPDAIVLCPCSTDQTVAYAEQIRTGRNPAGAGGFYHGSAHGQRGGGYGQLRGRL